MTDPGAVLVIGASSGMGASIAVEYARRGRSVALVARRGDELAAVRERCREAAGGADEARAWIHDVRDYEDVPELFRRIEADRGEVDTIVYAAGVMPGCGPEEFDFGKDRPVLEIGLLGAVAWLDEAARRFQERGRGRICAISSIAGERGRRAYPSYHAAKAGLTTFLESLRNRLAVKGIGVTTIKPGFIDTPMTRGMKGLFWLISADEAARRIVRLVERRAGERFVPARWALVAFVIRNIPSFIFRRTDI